MIYNPNELASTLGPEVQRAVKGQDHPHSLGELDKLVFLALIKQFKPTRVLEFGTCEGSTPNFILGRPEAKTVIHWVSIDKTHGMVPNPGYRAFAHRPKFELVVTDGSQKAFCQAMLRFGPCYFDCVLMDAVHDWSNTRKHTEMCDWLLKPSGLRLWHDYGGGSKKGKYTMTEYIDGLIHGHSQIFVPRQEDRCTVAWEVKLL